MTVRYLRTALLVLAGLAVASTALTAQKGKKKPPAPEPVVITGTAEIRCVDEIDPLADVICADGMGDYVHGDPGVTVWLGEHGNLLLRVSADPGLERSHVVRIPDFDAWDSQDCDPACVAPIPDGGLTVFTEPRSNDNAYIGAGNNLAGGLAGMADGTSELITMLIGFPDPDPASNIRWSLYWDPEYYDGTSWATATRTGCTWTITADNNALAGFWLFRVRQGKIRDTQEGRFKAPVQITFTADPETVPGGC